MVRLLIKELVHELLELTTGKIGGGATTWVARLF